MANKNYFTKDTELAIIEYNHSNIFEEKEKIYHSKIHYPFFKLTENIIHTYKFYYTEVENIEDLQHEIICFLLEKIHKYDHKKNIEDKFCNIIKGDFKEEYDTSFIDYVGADKKLIELEEIREYINTLNVSEECREVLMKIYPPKAYSYFGTIVKNYLILNNNKNYKKKVDKVPTDELTKDLTYTYEIDDDGLDKDRLSNFLDEYVEYCFDHLIDLFPKPNDFKIADAILTVFSQRDGLDIFNKKAIYIYLREMTDATTPQITRIASKLSDLFQEHYLFYLENGYTNFEKEEYL